MVAGIRECGEIGEDFYHFLRPHGGAMFKGKLRTKFLLSLVLISTSLTCATLLIVRHRVLLRVRAEIFENLRNSVTTFQILQRQREAMLERSASLLANLPPLKAVMTSQHEATIQDASAAFWRLAGSELFVLADRSGKLMAIHTTLPGLNRNEAQELLSRSLQSGESRDWWYGNGRLFEVFMHPIYLGPAAKSALLGVLAVGNEINEQVAADVGRVAASRVAFRYGETLVISTLSATQELDLVQHSERPIATGFDPEEVRLGQERFLATSVPVAPRGSPEVSLTVLKSYDQATAFLESLNRWILLVGIAAVLIGGALVFLISTTLTRPLARLVAGVRALEKGDFSYPTIEARSNDEVSELTVAFDRMRSTLQETQRELLSSERLATIGRMASTISHDLRHPLTAILAYAEFLSEGNLSASRRQNFYEEIRLAVNRMTEQVNSLLGFSRERETIQPAYNNAAETVKRAIQTVQTRREFQHINITLSAEGECSGWFDPSKLERVLQNLLSNACESVDPETGKIDVYCRRTSRVLEIRVVDNGTGIPEPIRDTLFQPFVSHGKESGIGLGLTAVQKIVQDHGGEVSVEATGPSGTVFKLVLPLNIPAAKLAEQRHA